jgi:hypothetical protein
MCQVIETVPRGTMALLRKPLLFNCLYVKLNVDSPITRYYIKSNTLSS